MHALSRQSLRIMLIGSALTLSLMLVGCADDDNTQNFPPLTYTYLSQMHLNVSRVDIVDNAPPGSEPGDISAKAPTTPDQALQEMARDRLIASGSDGSAIFTITHASILHEPGGTLKGDLNVQVEVQSPTGTKAGYAEAHVSRSMSPGDQNPESRPVLYALTSQMMQDMNVELEFQVKKSLKDWLVDAGGASLEGAIQQQNLTGDAPVETTSPASDTSLEATSPQSSATSSTAAQKTSTAPDAVFPTGDDDSDTPTTDSSEVKARSPQPGVLKLPQP